MELNEICFSYILLYKYGPWCSLNIFSLRLTESFHMFTHLQKLRTTCRCLWCSQKGSFLIQCYCSLPIHFCTGVGLFFHNTQITYSGAPAAMNRIPSRLSLGFWYTVSDRMTRLATSRHIGRSRGSCNKTHRTTLNDHHVMSQDRTKTFDSVRLSDNVKHNSKFIPDIMSMNFYDSLRPLPIWTEPVYLDWPV